MIKHAIIFVVLVGWLLSYGNTGEASGQSADGWTRLPCEYIPGSTGIFIGDVTAVKPDGKTNDEDFVLIEFTVRAAISGVARDAKVAARSSAASADSIDIAPGRTFLVYLGDDQGKRFSDPNPGL